MCVIYGALRTAISSVYCSPARLFVGTVSRYKLLPGIFPGTFRQLGFVRTSQAQHRLPCLFSTRLCPLLGYRLI